MTAAFTKSSTSDEKTLPVEEAVMNADEATDGRRLSSILARQREAFLRAGAPTLAKRRADLLKLKKAILARRNDYETAISADFGHRPAHETAIMEILPTVQGIDYLRKNLPRWMRPRSRMSHRISGRRPRRCSISRSVSSASCRRGIIPQRCASCPWRPRLPPAIVPWSNRRSLRRKRRR